MTTPAKLNELDFAEGPAAVDGTAGWALLGGRQNPLRVVVGQATTSVPSPTSSF